MMAVVTNYILFLANSPKNFLSAPTHRPPPPPRPFPPEFLQAPHPPPPPPPPAASPQLKIGSAMAS